MPTIHGQGKFPSSSSNPVDSLKRGILSEDGFVAVVTGGLAVGAGEGDGAGVAAAWAAVLALGRGGAAAGAEPVAAVSVGVGLAVGVTFAGGVAAGGVGAGAGVGVGAGVGLGWTVAGRGDATPSTTGPCTVGVSLGAVGSWNPPTAAWAEGVAAIAATAAIASQLPCSRAVRTDFTMIPNLAPHHQNWPLAQGALNSG